MIKWKVEVAKRPSRYLLLIYKHVADNGDMYDDEIRGQIECHTDEEKEEWIKMISKLNDQKSR